MTADKNQVASDKKRKLEMTVAAIRQRWGIRAIDRAAAGVASVPHVPTGFAALDEALGIGGFPRGRISEIVGVPTSGMATLALKSIASAQAAVGTAQAAAPARASGTAVYIDLDRNFDPDYAARCGVRLDQLVLIRPYSERQALAILQDFALGGGLSLLIFDAHWRLLARPRVLQALSNHLDRLVAPLARSTCALLFLTSLPPRRAASLADYPAHSTLPHYASVRLLIQKESWIYRRRDILGYQAQVLLAKNKLGPSGKQVRLAITFNGVVKEGQP